MPILVQQPGGSADTAGRGMAAAQQYRAGEQRMQQIDLEAARRAEEFQFEKETTLRTLDFQEQQAALERQQLQEQQNAEADALMAFAAENGADLGDGGMSREVLAKTSPRFRTQMAAELGRSFRLRKESEQQQRIVDELEKSPDIYQKTRERMDAGELVETDAIERSMARDRRAAAKQQETATDLEAVRGNWQTWKQDPQFDMPSEDDEAYDDVQDLLAAVMVGEPDGSKNYMKLWNQLKLLTTKGMREAVIDIYKRDVQNQDVFGLPKGTAAKYVGEQRVRNAVGMSQMYKKAGLDANGNEAPVPAEDAKGASKKGASAKPGAPSDRLKEPVPAKLAGIENMGDMEAGVQDALDQLGITSRPAPGTPEYRVVQNVIKMVRDRMAETSQEQRKKEAGMAGSKGMLQ